ncbi:inverse autotransporter beta domain-containing protein [Enterobacter sp. CC120223-11]|uniref:inverse autotransporter beta domain-containing protein n=1 Tax=Enterobacter sp. CC120223-11 TaxID=1378073 RepID=UPI0015965196|nr:inverse autotransporter beta domain-containing protein [Enterobacter sp. CC120223-11]
MTEQQPRHFILYHKPLFKSWQEIEREKAPEVEGLELNQQALAQQYGLTLNEWLLLPASGPKSQLDILVTLVKLDDKASLDDVAFRGRTTPAGLLELNQRVKSPEQMKVLAGQWIIVPQGNEARTTEAADTDEDADRLRDQMAAAWGSAQQSGAGNALRSTANSAVNAALTQEVESWLNHTGGKARVTADVGLGNSDSRDAGLDFLWPVKIWQDDILFTQMSAHRWNDRNILNLGLGLRHTFSPHLLAGGNLFFDQDVTRHHSRMGLGAELWSDRVRTSANYYLPVSGWRHSDDSVFNDDPTRYELYERAARGWDINVDTALSQHVSATVGWFQWYGDKVDVNGSRSEASSNPHGLKLGVNWQPVPLLSVNAEQSFISGQSDNFSVGLNFHWEFGRKLSQMLSADEATAMPSLMQSRTEFVTRNNNIVLAYKQKEKDWRLYFTPTEKSTPVGVPMRHAVKGGKGGVVRYASSSVSIAGVDEVSGLVTPKQRGEVTVTATETSPTGNREVFSSASYHLTVTPGDFAPSVTEVAIAGEMSPGQNLTGSYRYDSNEGEDEDPAQTQLRWIDKASGKLLKEGSANWEVRAEDMTKTLVFQVTPVNKKGVSGEAGTAEISGSATLTALRIDHLLTPGEIRSDGSVKFFAHDNGALLLVAEVKDDKGAPLADQWVHWQSTNVLGKLSQNSVRTDAHGQALVKMEGIMAEGQDQIEASLTPATAGFSNASAGDDDGSTQREMMKLTVDFARALSTEFTEIPATAEVATTQDFAIRVTDQDGAPLTVPTAVIWKSNGDTYNGTTDNQGHASMTLTAPQKVADGWNVSVDVGDAHVAAPPVTLTAGDVARTELTVPERAVAGSSAVDVSAELFDRFDNPVVSRKNAIEWQIKGGQFSGAASGDSNPEGQVTAKVIVPEVAPSEVEVSAGKSTKKLQVLVGTVDSVELSSSQDTLTANGSNSAILTAIARDAHRNVVPDASVTWTAPPAEFGTLSDQIITTSKEGIATARFTTASLGGKADIGVEIEGQRKQAKIALNGIPVVTSVTLDRMHKLKVGETLRVADYQVEENGSGPVTMSWQWTRDGSLISGATSDHYTLTEADTGAQMAVLSWAQNGAGNRGDKASGKTDKIIGLINQVVVTSSSSSVNADGHSELTFTAVAKDKNGVAVPEEKMTWKVDQAELVTVTSQDDLTDDNGEGVLRLTVKNLGGGLRITADIGGKTDSSDVSLKGIPVIKLVTLEKSDALKVGDVVRVDQVAVEENGGGDVALTYQWGRESDSYSGGIGGATGSSYTLKETDAGAKIFVYVTATNGAGNKDNRQSDSTRAVIGHVDTVDVTATADAINANGSDSVTFTLEAKDKWKQPVPRENILWQVDEPSLIEEGSKTLITDAQGKGTLTVKAQKMGGTVKLTATVDGKKGDKSIVLKGIPEVTTVTLTKTRALKVGDTLGIAELKANENGGGAVTWAYHWAYDTGSESAGISLATGSTYTLTEGDTGRMIYLYVTATNAAGNQGSGSSDLTERVVGKVAKVVVSADAESVEVDDVKTITFTATATDRLNVAVPDEKIAWSVDNPALISSSTKDESTDNSGTGKMVVTLTTSGGSIKATADVASHKGDDSVQLKGSPVVSNTRYTSTGSSTPLVDDRLMASADVNENGGGRATLTWQWLRNGTAIAAPAASNSYTLQAADIGATVSAMAIATNGAGKKGQDTSPASAAVQSGVPEITSATVNATGQYWTGNKLAAGAGWSENGGGTATLTYQWLRGGSAITGATGVNYTPVSADIGSTLSVKVTATNLKGKQGSKTSNSTRAITSGTPTVSDVTLSKMSDLLVGDTINVREKITYNGAITVNTSSQWLRNGVAISGATGDTYTTQPEDAGKRISASVTATNASDSKRTHTATSSQTDVVQSGVPEITSVSIDKTKLSVGEKLTATYTGFDAQGTGSDDSRFQWYYRVSGSSGSWVASQKSDARQRVFTPDSSYAGYDVRVGVTPKGSAQSVTGTEVFSRSASVYGTPKIGSVSTSPQGTVQPDTTVTASYTGYDAQGTGSDDSRYQWYYRSSGSSGSWSAAGKSDATQRSFRVDSSYAGYDVRVGVTPKGSEQSVTGVEIFSSAVTIRPKPVPSATNLGYNGKTGACNRITANYTFNANGGADEGNTIFQWKWAGNVVSNVQGVTLGYWGEVTLYVTPVNKDGVRGATESKTFKNTGSSSCDW